VRAYGGPQFQVTQQVMTRFAEAVERSGVDLVPKVLIGTQGVDGDGIGGNASVVGALLALLLSDRVGALAPAASADEGTDGAEARESGAAASSRPGAELASELRREMLARLRSSGGEGPDASAPEQDEPSEVAGTRGEGVEGVSG
jgi:hypothetical protein